MRLNTCLHIMYLLLVIGAIVFWLMGRMVLGWVLWFVGFGLWCVLFSVELKQIEDADS